MKVEHVVLLKSRWTRALTMLLFLGTAVAVIPCNLTARAQQPAPQKFTLAQIEGLVEQKVPDATLSNQIRLHGLAFAPTPAILDELRAKGAGSLTIAAIQSTKTSPQTEHKNSPPQKTEPAQAGRDWSQNSPIPVPRGSSLDELRENEIWEGGQYGLGTERDFGRLAAVFSAANSSRIEYGGYISNQGQGTLELWIKVNHGYRYDNYQFKDNLDEAIVFSSDCSGGDVTWPGATKLTVKANGDISLYMATSKYDKPASQPTIARGTPFRFGEWHAIGISYGSQGQWIMLDGEIVAASPFLTQTLGRAGNHQEPLDQATIGETVCHFWDRHRYEGGFDGVVAGVRLSNLQKDWALALGLDASRDSEMAALRPAEGAGKGKNPHSAPATGEVDVQTEPGSAVFLDGNPAGNADAQGFLSLPAVPAGNHELIAKNDGYQDAHLQFTLTSSEDKQVNLPLTWQGGYLAVSVQPGGAAVTVAGPKTFTVGPAEVKCLPGTYTVTASLDGYLSQTRTVQIAAGEHHNETFALLVDPAVLVRKLDDARSKLGAGDSAGAEQLADMVLNQSPGNLDAALIVAEAAFQLGDMNRFVEAGTEAIRGGKQVTVRTMHAHTVLALWIHPVDFTISESGISVVSNPPDSRCKIPPSVGFDLIESAQVVRDPQRGFIELHIQYASKPHGTILHDLDFVPDSSQVVTTRAPGQVFGSGASSIQEPGNAGQILDGILRLMTRTKR
jgi:hypothetical protein